MPTVKHLDSVKYWNGPEKYQWNFDNIWLGFSCGAEHLALRLDDLFKDANAIL